MAKALLLVAVLGSLMTLAEPAAAGGYGLGQPGAPTSVALRVLVLPTPRSVQHHHRSWQLRPQPVFGFAHPPPIRHHWQAPPVRHFWHAVPRGGWQRPPHHVERRFQGGPWRHGGQWSHGFGRHHEGRGWHAARGRHGAGHSRHRR